MKRELIQSDSLKCEKTKSLTEQYAHFNTQLKIARYTESQRMQKSLIAVWSVVAIARSSRKISWNQLFYQQPKKNYVIQFYYCLA